MKKFLAPLICGFGAGVLQIVPLIKSFTCCFILPIAAFSALMLDQKANNTNARIPMKKAFVFGLLTGLTAAFFGSIFEIFITLITRQNDVIIGFSELQRMVDSFPVTPELKQQVMDIFQSVKNDLMNYGFSWFYTFAVIANNLIVNSIFGIVGGLIGAQVINNKNKKQTDI